MDQVLTAEEFKNAVRNLAGMSEETVRGIMREYEPASSAARAAIGSVMKIGFFTGKMERIEAFMIVCREIDKHLAAKRINADQSVIVIYLLMFSSSDFKKAITAFTRFAHGYRFQTGLTSDSKTADIYFKSAIQC